MRSRLRRSRRITTRPTGTPVSIRRQCLYRDNHGHESDRLRACAHCHYHNGQGKPENGHVTGLPVNYFLQQLALFRSGGRTSADPRKANHAEMAQIARFLTDAEMKAAAQDYAAIAWKPWVKVVENDMAPQTRQSAAGLFIPLPSQQA